MSAALRNGLAAAAERFLFVFVFCVGQPPSCQVAGHVVGMPLDSFKTLYDKTTVQKANANIK